MAIEAYMDRYLAAATAVLREECRLTRMVRRDVGGFAERGDTIQIPRPGDSTSYDVAPSSAPYTGAAPNADKVDVVINRHRASSFVLTDKERATMDAGMAMESSGMACVRTLANYVDQQIADECLFDTAIGAQGTTPFASNLNDAINAKIALDENAAPGMMRYGILTPQAEAAFLARDGVQQADRFGTRDALARGEIGTVMGVSWHGNNHASTCRHDTGLAGAKAVNKSGGYAVGYTGAIAIDGNGSGVPHAGDIIAFGGAVSGTNRAAQYLVTANTANSITLSEPLRAAVADNAVIHAVATHTFTPVFHSDALVFVSRTNAMFDGLGGGMVRSTVDPVTGIAIRLEYVRQNKQVLFEFDILFGTRLVRPDLGTRLLQ